MAPITQLSHLMNPLISSAQLEASVLRVDGAAAKLEASVRLETACLQQAAGILLRLPQEITAQSIVLLQRFWAGAAGEILLQHDSTDLAAAATYVVAKSSAHTVSPRQVLTVFDYLHAIAPNINKVNHADGSPDVDWRLTDGQYEARRDRLYKTEAHMLRAIGFETHVALPYTLCINYLQTLEAFQDEEGSRVAKRAFAHLNSGLLSPQLLYLTHQPSALATAAIYLAAREIDVKLPEVEWWEVFDVDREELGFLVVALLSIEGFFQEEKRKWNRRRIPLTIGEVRVELERRQMLKNGQ